MEEDYKLFQLVKRNPIRSCVELSRHMTGRVNGVVYFTESFRIDFEKRMYALDRLEQENKELKENNQILQKQLNGAFDRGFIHKSKIKEKIEELDKRIEEYEEKQKNDMFNFWHNEFLKACHYKQALQGLLRGGVGRDGF